MNKFNRILLLLLLTPFHFFAQSNYKKATVVLINKQQLNGAIDYKEWGSNPRSFSFKDKEGERVLSIQNVASFTIDTFETFERNVFTAKGSGKVRYISEIRMGHDYKMHSDTVFLRLVTEGPMLNLYAYEDNLSIRYFVKVNKTAEFQELQFDQYFNETNQQKIESSSTFKGQLTIFANDNSAQNKSNVLGKLPHLSYDEHSLSTIVNLLNGKESENNNTHYYVVKPFVGAFLQRSNLSYSGDFPLAENASGNPSYRPGINVGFDFYNNYTIRKYKVRVELSFSSASFNTDKVVVSDITGTRGYNHSFNQYNIIFAPQFIMNIYNTPSLKVNAGLGLACNYSIYSNNEYIRSVSQYGLQQEYLDNFDFRKFTIALPFRAGVTVRKFDIYAKYSPMLSGITNYISYNASIQAFQLGVNYLF